MKALQLNILFAVVFTTQACTVARMHIPESFGQVTQEFPVERSAWSNSSTPYRFGEFVASDVKKDRIEDLDLGLSFRKGFYIRVVDSKLVYSFRLADNEGNNWDNKCAIRRSDNTTTKWTRDDSHFLHCALLIEKNNGNAYLELDSVVVWPPEERLGRLQTVEEDLRIRMSRQYAKTPIRSMDVLGYFFELQSKQVGAVEVINQGRVFFGKDLSQKQRRVLAAASVALMIFERTEQFTLSKQPL